jgi:hypothetical protein
MLSYPSCRKAVSLRGNAFLEVFYPALYNNDLDDSGCEGIMCAPGDCEGWFFPDVEYGSCHSEAATTVKRMKDCSHRTFLAILRIYSHNTNVLNYFLYGMLRQCILAKYHELLPNCAFRGSLVTLDDYLKLPYE